jgi:NTE family protein
LWDGGVSDVRHAVATEVWRNATEMAQGIYVYDATPLNPAQKESSR